MIITLLAKVVLRCTVIADASLVSMMLPLNVKLPRPLPELEKLSCAILAGNVQNTFLEPSSKSTS